MITPAFQTTFLPGFHPLLAAISIDSAFDSLRVLFLLCIFLFVGWSALNQTRHKPQPHSIQSEKNDSKLISLSGPEIVALICLLGIIFIILPKGYKDDLHDWCFPSDRRTHNEGNDGQNDSTLGKLLTSSVGLSNRLESELNLIKQKIWEQDKINFTNTEYSLWLTRHIKNVDPKEFSIAVTNLYSLQANQALAPNSFNDLDYLARNQLVQLLVKYFESHQDYSFGIKGFIKSKLFLYPVSRIIDEGGVGDPPKAKSIEVQEILYQMVAANVAQSTQDRYGNYFFHIKYTEQYSELTNKIALLKTGSGISISN